MREVGILEAKTHLSALVEEVERKGEEIVITRHGKPVAELRRAQPARRLGGEQLMARFDALRARLSAENPEIDALTWDDIKDWRDG